MLLRPPPGGGGGGATGLVDIFGLAAAKCTDGAEAGIGFTGVLGPKRRNKLGSAIMNLETMQVLKENVEKDRCLINVSFFQVVFDFLVFHMNISMLD